MGQRVENYVIFDWPDEHEELRVAKDSLLQDRTEALRFCICKYCELLNIKLINIPNSQELLVNLVTDLSEDLHKLGHENSILFKYISDLENELKNVDLYLQPHFVVKTWFIFQEKKSEISDSNFLHISSYLKTIINCYSNFHYNLEDLFNPYFFKYYLPFYDTNEIKKILQTIYLSPLHSESKKIKLLQTCLLELNNYIDFHKLILKNSHKSSLTLKRYKKENIWNIEFSYTDTEHIKEFIINLISGFTIKITFNSRKGDIKTFLQSILSEFIDISNIDSFIDQKINYHNSEYYKDSEEEYYLTTNYVFKGIKIVRIFRILLDENFITSSKAEVRDWLYYTFVNEQFKGLSKGNIWDYLTRKKYALEDKKPFQKINSKELEILRKINAIFGKYYTNNKHKTLSN